MLRAEPQCHCQYKANDKSNDDDNWVTSGIDFHKFCPTPLREHRGMGTRRENAPNYSSAINAVLNFGKSRTNNNPMITGRPYE